MVRSEWSEANGQASETAKIAYLLSATGKEHLATVGCSKAPSIHSLPFKSQVLSKETLGEGYVPVDILRLAAVWCCSTHFKGS
jgi:hypothetical protein